MARLRLLTGLRRVAIARRVIHAIQYSAITERKSKAYKACVMSDQWNQLCVVSAMDYGKCSLWVICNCLCGVKVNVMEEWPLVASEQKFMARIRDIAPPKERLPDAPIQSRRAVERRRSRGRDGGPGPRGSGVAGDQGRAGSQGRDEGTGAHQGWADGTGAHQGGADGTGAHQGGADGTGAHQGGADGTGAHQGGADDHQTGTDGVEDHLGGTDGPEDHGRDWDLGNTETHKTVHFWPQEPRQGTQKVHNQAHWLKLN